MSEAKPTKGERTRRLLLDCVIRLVHERPLADVKIGDVCTAAGVATGAFYFHFGSRDEALVAAALDGLSAVYRDVLAAPSDPDLHSEVVGIIAVFDRYRCERPDLIAAIYTIVNAYRPVRLAWHDERLALVERLARRFAVARGEDGGGFGSCRVLAHFLLGALERFYDDVFFGPVDAALTAEAATPAVFVDQQAAVWVRAVTGSDPIR